MGVALQALAIARGLPFCIAAIFNVVPFPTSSVPDGVCETGDPWVVAGCSSHLVVKDTPV